MNRQLVRSVILLATLVGARSPAHALETSVEKARAMLLHEDLGGGVHVFRAPEALDVWTSTNSVVIINDSDIVVFDSPTRAVTARAVIAEIRELTPKPVTVLVNSHWHQDHWSGNDEYSKAFPGLRIVASQQTRDYMTRMGPGFFAEGTRLAAARQRTALDEAKKTGRFPDGSALTAEERKRRETEIADAEQFAAEVLALTRVLPNTAYRDEMTLWSGAREMRLFSVTGDATASTVLYLPGSRLLATGDVLVSPEDGHGPPPWTTNSYSVTPWLETLRRLESLDLAAVVPGQGPVMHDKAYLHRTAELFAGVIGQVQTALERGSVRFEDVRKAVDVDRIGAEYTPGAPLAPGFHDWVDRFSKKAMQEALDGVARAD